VGLGFHLGVGFGLGFGIGLHLGVGIGLDLGFGVGLGLGVSGGLGVELGLADHVDVLVQELGTEVEVLLEALGRLDDPDVGLVVDAEFAIAPPGEPGGEDLGADASLGARL